MSWFKQVLSLELRKQFSYRVQFWFQFLGSVLTFFVAGYFLWTAIFTSQNATQIGGYSFEAMLLFYLFAPLVDGVVRGSEWGFVSKDIYDGSLTRYLVYPISFSGYKFASHLSIAVVAFVQLFMVLTLYALFVGFPLDAAVGFSSITMGCIATIAGAYLYFVFALIIEMLAFWVDNVWSLMVMLRFAILILGAGLVPLSLYPDWAQNTLQFLPFTYMAAFPINCFVGRVEIHEFFFALVKITAWCGFFYWVGKKVWSRGMLRYTGVGI
jgi:ABC-2 type transport system permease protein